jgi:hypothetical protein
VIRIVEPFTLTESPATTSTSLLATSSSFRVPDDEQDRFTHTVHSALAELELSAAVLLAEQEEGLIYEARGRLHRALTTVHDTRALAVELADATGRPVLRVLCGGPSPAATTRRGVGRGSRWGGFLIALD